MILNQPDSAADFRDNFWDRIYQNDCGLILPQIPDASVDLVLTDPPYKDYQSNRPVAHNKVKKIRVEHFDIPMFISQSARVLKPGAHFYCWCDHSTFPALVQAINDYNATRRHPAERLKYKNMLVWVKSNHGSGDLRGNFAPQHELIIFAVKGAKGRSLNGKRPSNVFFYKDDEGHIQFYKRVSNYRHLHGTSKPLEILEKLILVSTNPGDLVLDPYAGTLSTALAATKHGRRYLMIEKDGEYLHHNRNRLPERKV